MPFKSKAQARLFHAKAGGSTREGGPSAEVAKKFIADTKHQKLRDLPERKRKKVAKKRKGKKRKNKDKKGRKHKRQTADEFLFGKSKA